MYKNKDIINFLKSYAGEENIILAAINPNPKPSENPIVTTEVRPNDLGSADNWVSHFINTHNLYFEVNPAHYTGQKSQKQQIKNVRYLHCDLDISKEFDQSTPEKLKKEKEKIQKKIKSFSKKPTFIIDSGGGYSLFWKLEKSYEREASSWNEDKIEDYNKKIIEDLDGDKSCWNVDRLMRLPFTHNFPSGAKEKKRPFITESSLIFHNPKNTYSLDSFEKIEREEKTKTEIKVEVDLAKLPQINTREDLRSRGIEDRTIGRIVDATEANGEAVKDRSANATTVVNALIHFGIPDDEIMAILLNRKFKISQTIYESKRGPHAQALKVIGDCKNYIKNKVVKEGEFDGSSDIPDDPDNPENNNPEDNRWLDTGIDKHDDLFLQFSKREDVVYHWLPSEGLSVILAQYSAGKTVELIDLSLTLECTANTWHGNKLAKDFHIIYFCGEDSNGALLHYYAWCQYHKIHPDDGRFTFYDEIPQIPHGDDRKQVKEMLMERFGNKKTLLVFDTWQRATSQISQNDDQDMQNAVKAIEDISKSINAPALAAVHPPKNSGRGTILGSSVLANSTMAIWDLEVEGQNDKRKKSKPVLGGLDVRKRTLSVDRIKGPGYGNWMEQRFEYIEIDDLPLDEYGEKFTGLVPVCLNRNEDNAKSRETLIDKAEEQRKEYRAQFGYIIYWILGNCDLEHPHFSAVVNEMIVNENPHVQGCLKHMGLDNSGKTKLRIELDKLFNEDRYLEVEHNPDKFITYEMGLDVKKRKTKLLKIVDNKEETNNEDEIF